jgi:kynurenine formamidase
MAASGRPPRDTPIAEQLAHRTPRWGRWGEGDEIGGLNFLDSEEVLRGVATVRKGRTFTLGIPLASPQGDPVWPGRTSARRFVVQDKSSYLAGHAESPAGDEFADDILFLYAHGTTHTDALGHVWYDDTLYNGYPAMTTIGRLERASVFPLAEHGIVGRATLLDIARHRGKARLEQAEAFGLADLLATADSQGSVIERHDIVVVRTGWLSAYYNDRQAFDAEPFREPGLLFSDELVDWFEQMEIPALCSDTLGNELTVQPEHGANSVLHASLMRNLGVVFTEMLWLEDLAEDCAADGNYAFLFASAPLKVVGGSGAPTNPLAIK